MTAIFVQTKKIPKFMLIYLLLCLLSVHLRQAVTHSMPLVFSIGASCYRYGCGPPHGGSDVSPHPVPNEIPLPIVASIMSNPVFHMQMLTHELIMHTHTCRIHMFHVLFTFQNIICLVQAPNCVGGVPTTPPGMLTSLYLCNDPLVT